MLNDASRSQAVRFAPVVVFIGAIFVSAALLFSVQPIVARMALPRLGGSPAVWTTAMLFFQAVLLAGYVYAHLLTTRLGHRAQAAVHGAVLAAGALFLPIALPALWQFDPGQPVSMQVLALFAAAVGLPFFALSANAPLLQRWYAASGAADAHDPYFLYAASNIGSVAALLSYPLLLEPLFGTGGISGGWAVGYCLFGAAFVACALAVPAGGPQQARRAAPAVPALRWWRWVALAFVPSSLMLSTTQLIATDVGSFPLLWVIPLSLYLLSFAVAFSRRARLPRAALALIFQVSIVLAIVVLAGAALGRLHWFGVGLMLVTFSAAALFFHFRLHDDRPEPAALTSFYLAMSLGGVLGGIFNALVAPAVFSDLIEAPAVLALAGLALSGAIRPGRDVLTAALLIIACICIRVLAGAIGLQASVAIGVGVGVGGLLLLLSRHRPLQFAVLACGLLLIGSNDRESVVERSRSFFGIYTVRDHPDGTRRLRHGTTIHGKQYRSGAGSQSEILSYYHPAAPMGQVVSRAAPDARIGIVGLGVGALSCYVRPGQDWTFYEIDREVDRIARDPALFGYMDRCGRDMPTVLGDARVTLERDPARRFDLLVIDAFSSDTIPVHLLTVEALRLYRDRLEPGGMLLLHVSNRFFDLPPVLGRIAPRLGLSAATQDRSSSPVPIARGEDASLVVMMTDGPLPDDPRWHPLPDDGGAPWTDDHANLLGALR